MSIYDSMTEQQELAFLRQILGNMDRAKTASETSSVPQKTPSPEALARLKDKIKDGRWTGGTNSDGYPKVKIDGQSELASHVLLKSLGRGLKPGQVVMHRNNDKLDMSPAHLRVGTQQQNLKQMRDEGRDRPRGVDQEPDMKKKADELEQLPVDLRKLAANAAARMAKRLVEAGDHTGAAAVGSAMGQLGNAPRLVKNISKGGEEAMVDLMVGQSRLAGPGTPGGLFARKLYKPDSLITRGVDTSTLLAEKQRLTDAARNLSPEARAMTPAMHGHQELHTGTPVRRHISDHEFVPNLKKIPRAEALQSTHQIQQQVVQPLRARGLEMADLPKVEPGGQVSGNASNVMRGPDGQPRILDFLPQGGSSPVQMEGHVVRSPYLSREMDPGFALKPGGTPFSSTSATPNQMRREVFQPTTGFRQKTLATRPSSLAPQATGSTAVTSVEGATPVTKVAELKTELLPHQQRVVERMQEPDRKGLVVIHGLGSGKTLTSIATQDALGTPATVVVPAALQENYRKEQAKHLKGKPEKTHIETLQRVALEGGAHPSPLTIFDEAHRLRDHTSASFQAAKQPGTDKRLLLTGSPFYNDPSDIAPLVNLAANRKVLPMGKEEFGSRYVGLKKVSPGFIQEHFMGIQPGEVPVLNERRADELRQIFAEHTDFHPGSTENFPRVDRRDVVVPMSKEQKEVYDTLMGQAPSWVAKKVKAGLPPSKQEMQSMGAFLTAPRQAVNSTSPYVKDEAAAQSPKIQKAFENLQALMKENPNAKAVIYSNFIDAGINPYKKLLEGAGIAHGEFTGSQNAKARDQMVKDYNEGKLKALLLSSAGGEGLDLKGTRLVQMLEPHWNEEKLKQVEGRAARYGSHSHLTPEEQQVLVERYLSGIEPGIVQKIKGKLFGSKPDQSVDQYLAMMSKDKESLNKQFRDLLPRHEKTAAPRWVKEVRKGFIGLPEVNTIVDKNVPGHNLVQWGLESPVNPERLTAHLQGRSFEVPELPAGTVPGKLPKELEGWSKSTPAAPTPSKGLLSVSERAALRDPNSKEVFAPGSPYPRTYPEEVKKNPLYDLQLLMDPGLKGELEEATRGGLRHLRKEMGQADTPLAQLPINQRKQRVELSKKKREFDQVMSESDARLKVLREQAASSLAQQRTAMPAETVQASDRPFPWKPVLGATAAVAAPAAAYVAYDHLKNRSEKQAEEEPSALRSHLLHGLGYALPIQASFGALPLALRLQGAPHSGKLLAASQLVAAPLSYLSMRGHGERQEAEAKRRAKVVAKNARKMPELEEDAELSGLALGGRALKSSARGIASAASPLLLTSARTGDPAALKATAFHTALSAPAHLIGGLARTLEDRDTARMALSRLGDAQKDQDLSDGRKLVRLKKQVAKLEGKLSDEL